LDHDTDSYLKISRAFVEGKPCGVRKFDRAANRSVSRGGRVCAPHTHFEPPNLDHAGELGAGFIELLRKHGASKEIEDQVIPLVEAWRTGAMWSYFNGPMTPIPADEPA